MPAPPNSPRLFLATATLPADLLAAIGNITVSWGHVLTLIEVAIWGMLGLSPKKGIALTNAFKFAGKMDMLKAVGGQFFRGAPEAEQFKAIVKRVFDLYAERNDLEHAIWSHVPPGTGGLSVRVRIRRKDQSIDAKPMTAADVDAINQQLIQLIVDLNDFMEKHVPEPAPNT